MSKLLQIGMSTAGELSSTYGHIACTLGGVNYESRGSKGCLRGSAARGATHSLFRHTFHMLLSNAAAASAQEYGNACAGQPYVLGQVPSSHRGGDCSGLISGIICEATGKPIKRLFTTATWLSRFDDLGFAPGLGVSFRCDGFGKPDRPFPGRVFTTASPISDHVKWIQARLNCAAHNHHAVLDGAQLDEDGDFGRLTKKVVVAFQRSHHLEDNGEVGRHTWGALLDVS
jgi:peptidoglycan hydrolase-like protein with peptidoglycan-binding domain